MIGAIMLTADVLVSRPFASPRRRDRRGLRAGLAGDPDPGPIDEDDDRQDSP